MSVDANYHRTFLPDGPFESDCRQSCHGNPKPVTKWVEFEPHKPSPGAQYLQQFQSADMRDHSKPKHYYRSQRRRAAFMLIGGKLVQTFIVERINHQFASVATPWELEFSELTKDGPDRFAPVVNPELMVIGHIGKVRGTRLIKVKDSPIPSYYYGSIEQYVAAEEVVLVSNTVPEGWEAFNPLQPNPIYTVLTDIFGDVQGGDITDSMPGAVATKAPWEIIQEVGEIISLATGVLGIGRALIAGLVKTIVRRKIVSMVISRTREAFGRTVTQVLAQRAARKAARVAAQNSYKPVTGITPKHHGAFVDAAQESKLIIVVRHNNPKSIALIEKGSPGKPKNLEFVNTSADTGIVTASNAGDVLRAQRLGYYVVRDGKTAQRIVIKNGKEVVEDLPVQSSFWKMEKGQVIDPATKKPIVGDYDLMGVIDPTKPANVMGLVVKDGKQVIDVTNATVQKAAAAVNKRLDIPRVLHGPQDMYKGYRKGASAYFPDGTVKHFDTESAVKAFYDSLKRQPRAGMHPRPSPGTPVVDELAARRNRK